MSGQVIDSNSDGILLVQAKMTNPNGNPADDNNPRIDHKTKTNLCSPFRLKRTHRDFIELAGGRVFVSRLSGTVTTPYERAISLYGALSSEALKSCVDVKLYGALVPIGKNVEYEVKDDTKKQIAVIKLKDKMFIVEPPPKQKKTLETVEIIEQSPADVLLKDTKQKEKKGGVGRQKQQGKRSFSINRSVYGQVNIQLKIKYAGEKEKIGYAEIFIPEGKHGSITLYGPVQPSWGCSLHPVELVEPVKITSAFASRGDAQQGTFGRMPIVYYSLLSFHVGVSRMRAKAIGMTEEELALLDYLNVYAIPAMHSATKQGQIPVLYMRVECKKGTDYFLGDFRDMLRAETGNGPIRSIRDLRLYAAEMLNYLNRCKERIQRVVLWEDPFRLRFCDIDGTVEENLEKIGLKVEKVPVSIPVKLAAYCHHAAGDMGEQNGVGVD